MNYSGYETLAGKRGLSENFNFQIDTLNVPAVYNVWAGIKGLCATKTAHPNVPE
jgi:hypothetical protein